MSVERLRNRKVVFQRVLMEVFRVNGRVKLDGGEDKFVTNLSCRESGELILRLCNGVGGSNNIGL